MNAELSEVELADWVRRSWEPIICGYCGKAYDACPAFYATRVLADHMRECINHPMRKLESDCAKLREALAESLGVEGQEELDFLEAELKKAFPASDKHCITMLKTIQVLRDTLPIP